MIDNVVMCEFLQQFKAVNNWAVLEHDLKSKQCLDAAKDLGFIKNWIPKNGPTSCCYYATAICTLKGRLFMRKNQ